MDHGPSVDRRWRSRLPGAVLLGALLLAGCGTGTNPDRAHAVIGRDTFIATYVDLRLAVLEAVPGAMNDSVRSAILSRHGVTEQQLQDFVKVHGSNVQYMRDVWNRVEDRIRKTHPKVRDTLPPGVSGRGSVPEARRQRDADRKGLPTTH